MKPSTYTTEKNPEYPPTTIASQDFPTQVTKTTDSQPIEIIPETNHRTRMEVTTIRKGIHSIITAQTTTQPTTETIPNPQVTNTRTTKVITDTQTTEVNARYVD